MVCHLKQHGLQIVVCMVAAGFVIVLLKYSGMSLETTWSASSGLYGCSRFRYSIVEIQWYVT